MVTLMFRCNLCKLSIPDDMVIDERCPECGNPVKRACELDVPECSHGIIPKVVTCPKCGEFMCPECGCHDVEVLSRTTGYYAPVSSFGSGKQQEFRDRKRYEV
jgi:hypothetical protein